MKAGKTKRADYPFFSQLFLFQGIEEEQIRNAFSQQKFTCIEAETGERVYSRECYQKSMGLVVAGRLRAYKICGEEPPYIMNDFNPGGTFGVAALFHTSEMYVSDIVAVKRSRILFFSQQLLQRFMREDIRIAENYIAYLSGRICYLNRRIDSLVGASAERRLCRMLEELTADRPAVSSFLLPFSLAEMAERLSMGRASLYRAFQMLEDEGVLTREGRCVTIRDPERLHDWKR